MILIPINETRIKSDTSNNIRIIKLKDNLKDVPKSRSFWMKNLEEIMYIMTCLLSFIYSCLMVF